MPCALTLALLIAQATAVTAPNQPPLEHLKHRYHSALVQRDVGWGLTALGLATLTAGAIVAGFGATEVNTIEPGGYDKAINYVIAGAVTGIVGIGLAIPGVVLALHGQGEMTDLEWRIRAASQMAYIAPMPSGGAMFGAHFTF